MRVEWDLVRRLKQYAEEHGLVVSERCTKAESPGARCRSCAPFFFSEVRERKAGPKVKEMLSRQQVTNAVISSLKLIGVDTAHFSGLSMRRGGISAALTARVQEPVMFRQSGHGSANAGRNYMLPTDPSVWYESFAALGL